jgi:hypothetical protein
MIEPAHKPKQAGFTRKEKKMKKPGKFLFVIVLLGANLLAACGKSTPPNANPELPSMSSTSPACSLLAKDDVSKVLGEAVEDVAGKGRGGVCTYNTKNSRFELTVTRSGGTQYIQGIRARLGQHAVDFPGLGDEALYNVFSYALIVRKGDAAYLISYYDSSHQLSDKDKQAKQKALAGLLMSSLH